MCFFIALFDCCLIFHKRPDVRHTTSKMMFSHSEQNWRNVMEKQSFADVLQNRCSKNFANFTGKPLCWSLFLKSCRVEAWNIIKKRLQRKCFPVKFAKFLRTPFLQNTTAGCLKACNFSKKRLQHRCFPVNILKFLKTPILKNICERLLLYILH